MRILLAPFSLRGSSLVLPPRANLASLKRQRCATTLAECVVSTVIVGALLVTGLRSAGSSLQTTQGIDDRGRAQRLAGDLMNEIFLDAYQEPGGSGGLGLDSGENTGNRTLFDDVDDYNNWLASPPTDPSGNVLPGLTGWTQAVSVTWANPATFASTASTNTGLKKITVTISKNGTPLASITGYRSIAWTDTIPAPSDATGNHAPTAVATSPSGLNKTHGQTVTFSATTSSDPDGDYLSYVWDFGDGTSAQGATTSHVYAAAGVYQIWLTVYDGRGGTAKAQLNSIQN